MSNNIKNEFRGYGKKMHTLGILAIFSVILSIISIIPNLRFFVIFYVILAIIMFFTMVSALGNIKKAGTALNNHNLLKYRSKLIIAFILWIIGSFIIWLGFASLGAGPFLNSLVIIGFGILLLLIRAILEIQAWGNLNVFFNENITMFPENIGKSAIKGSKYRKIAVILMIFAIFIIPAIVAFILRIIGNFKLGSLRKLTSAPVKEPSSPPAQPQPATEGPKKFCPLCGNPIDHQEKFCSGCGTPL